MSNQTLAIVFRNAHPERTPIKSKLYLLPRNSGDDRPCKSTAATHLDCTAGMAK